MIVVFHKMTDTPEVLAGLLVDVRKRYSFTQIVDLGAGSGGAMPEVIRRLNALDAASPVNLLLTDLHPNPATVNRINAHSPAHIRYRKEPLDATELKQAPDGVKTMINSFHHMPPRKAKSILASAQDHGEPLLIYEMAENNIPTLLWWLLLPLSLLILIVMVLFMTPFVRPLTWRQLLFTYLIPVVPISYAWDGQASLMRTYTFRDIESLLDGIKKDDYTWEMAPAKKANGKKLGYYVLGLPRIGQSH